MLIFGRPVASTEELTSLVRCVTHSEDIWRKDAFKNSAKLCGFKRIVERKSSYFSVAAFKYAAGQAIIGEDMIEEIRIFIGGGPADLSAEAFDKDKHKAEILANQYVGGLEEFMGKPRMASYNHIFESDNIRVRVLAPQPVWIVISNLKVIKALDRDYFSRNA